MVRRIVLDTNYFRTLVARDLPPFDAFISTCTRDGEDTSQPGTVVLVTQLEDRPGFTRIAATLQPTLYEQALTAHRDGRRVRASGTLVREGRSFRLDPVTSFEVLLESDVAPATLADW